jgi:hypothetical protein
MLTNGKFFDAVREYYPDDELKVEGNLGYVNGEVCIYFIALSTSRQLKSNNYPFVDLIVFDEFIIDKGRVTYLKSEVEVFLDLYETIARMRDNVRAVLLANSITIVNPYFLFWNLRMPDKQDRNGKYIWKHPTRPILVEDVRNEKFIDAKKNTEFGALVSGTRYAEYSIENKFLLDDDTFVEKKSGKARYYFTFIYKDKKFGVWADFNEGKLWVSEDIDPSYILTYALTLKDHKPNTMLLQTKGRKGHFKIFIDNYKAGNVYFESQNIKNLCYEVIQMVMN